LSLLPGTESTERLNRTISLPPFLAILFGNFGLRIADFEIIRRDPCPLPAACCPLPAVFPYAPLLKSFTKSEDILAQVRQIISTL
jgi:hypothetical protein